MLVAPAISPPESWPSSSDDNQEVAALATGTAAEDHTGKETLSRLAGIEGFPAGRWDGSGAVESEEGSDWELEVLPLHERLRLRGLEVWLLGDSSNETIWEDRESEGGFCAAMVGKKRGTSGSSRPSPCPG